MACVAPKYNVAAAKPSTWGMFSTTGLPPTGLRYCINSVILDFDKAQDAEKKYKEKE